MSLDPNAVRLANERLWKAHPELGRRALTLDAADAALRAEWLRYYKDAASASAPPPAVKPAPVLPPPPVSAIAACPPPTPTTVTDCKDVKNHLQEGDIVLRGNQDDGESSTIQKISGCEFSHAGIVARNDKGELVVIDAYPGRGTNNKNAVAEQTVDSFFCDHHATVGVGARPKDCVAAKKAAQWAYSQTKDPDYTFDLWDPWTNDPKRVYCSDFVYQSYQNAGVDLVPAKMDFLSPANKKNTLDAIRQYKFSARFASDAKLEAKLRAMTSSEYITPCQVAKNAETDVAVNFNPAKATGSGGKGKGKS
jgi:hypothetical protein